MRGESLQGTVHKYGAKRGPVFRRKALPGLRVPNGKKGENETDVPEGGFLKVQIFKLEGKGIEIHLHERVKGQEREQTC